MGQQPYVSKVARLFTTEMQISSLLCEKIDSPRSLACALLQKYGEWDQYLELTCNSKDYCSVVQFERDYLVTELLQKNPRLPTTHSKEQRALDKWLQAEHSCILASDRIDKLRDEPQTCDRWILSTALKVQQEIQRIIGPFPTTADLTVAELGMRFGPGSTTSVSGVVTYGRKYNNTAVDTTSSLVHYRTFCFPENWKEVVTTLNVVRGSKLVTVPKNAKTDRVICVEPDLNIFFQLGVGSALRRRLRQTGLDLNSQEQNQVLASYGVSLDLATVDLSSASDTISEAVVRFLLPPSWVELLEMGRSPEVLLPNKEWHRLAKWSSMGNGYTFELETLIFLACLRAVVPPKWWCVISAYGDDLILPSQYLGDLTRILEFFGFSMNTKKTFGTGLFRESCGSDWFNGQNVRPFFFRSENYDYYSVCYTYANAIRRYSSRHYDGQYCDDFYREAWDTLFKCVPPRNRYSIPEGFGDVGFVRPLSEVGSPVRRAREGWSGWKFPYRLVPSVRRLVSQEGLLLATLNGQGLVFSLGKESLRGRYLRATEKSGYTLAWPDRGVWV